MNDALELSGSAARVEIRSALPGRLRLWVPGLYRNEELKRTLEKGLNGSASRRTVSANVIAATLLVEGPKEAPTSSWLGEVESLLQKFVASTSTSLAELERRGLEKPKHLLVTGSGGAALFSPGRGKSKSSGQTKPPAAGGALGEEQVVHPWHTLDAQRISELLELQSAEGLSEADAETRLARFSANTLVQVARRSALAMFTDQFKELPVLLLAGSTVLSMLTGGIADGLVILGVIVINGTIGFVTENRAERTIASLTHDEAPDMEVRRQGEWRRLAMDGIVPGDVIRLGQGTFIPADARLLEAEDLTVDESALTGESMPVGKTVAAIDDKDLPLADRTNMVYRGTLVTGGSGTALVVGTGRATQVGQLQAMVGEVARPETPMQKQLRHLGERTMVLAGSVCGGVFVLGLLRGQPVGAMVRTAVSLAVAAIPEGLPTVAITTLALGIRKMKSHNVIVRRLDAIETLGAVQVLCFDKTGTITENRMRVVRVAVADEMFTVSAGKLAGESGGAGDAPARPELDLLLQVGALCSEATLLFESDAAPKIQGSSTEAALVDLALQTGTDVTALRETNPTHKTSPRTEQRKLMATIHRREQGSPFWVAVKGSPPEVLELCKTRLVDGQVVPLTDTDRRAIRRQNERMASEALRVLGMAYAEHAEEPASTDDGLVWLGLAGLADPPRAGLPELFEKFRRAGVRSVMITGDQSTTAYAIAKQVGLAVDGELRTLDSVELENMDPEVLANVAPHIQVFSRVSPRHKLRIVQALQKSGLVVAMTGDGINDCPALKAADIGVAMGGGSGSVAREVADVILETDDLHAMLTAIEHGRVIQADIKKAVRFILATNTSEILLTLLSVAAGFGHGLTPMQLLWINLVSDIFPELALAVQPAEQDVLEQPPRDPESKMFSSDELKQIAVEGGLLTGGALAAFGFGIARHGLSPAANTVSFVTLSTAQLLHAYNTRSEKNTIFDSVPAAPNRYIPISVGGGIALTLLMQLLPGARRWFGSTPLSPVDWAVSAVGAVVPLLANEAVKAARYAPRRGSSARALPRGMDDD